MTGVRQGKVAEQCWAGEAPGTDVDRKLVSVLPLIHSRSASEEVASLASLFTCGDAGQKCRSGSTAACFSSQSEPAVGSSSACPFKLS